MDHTSAGFRFVEDLAKQLSAKNLVFPTFLGATIKIRAALNDPDSTVDKAARVVSAEPVLVGQLLKLANSATLNPSGKKIADVKTAITRLGYNTVRSAAIAVAMRQMTQAKQAVPVQELLKDLWGHSLFVASTASVLARRVSKVSPDTAMLAGLLHDIGLFYILVRAGEYPELFTDEASLMAIAYEWHASVGHAILEGWDIPEEVTAAVDQHEDVLSQRIGPVNLLDVLMAADCLSGQVKPDRPTELVLEGLPVFHRLGLNASACDEILRESELERQAIMEALGG
jgi:putative nucleotidyltransferase with HDIG domain